MANGYDMVYVAAACEWSIVVTNVKGCSSGSVAQLAFGLLLELTHHIGWHSDNVRTEEWVVSSDFSYAKSPLIELMSKTLVLVGYGDIGRKVTGIGRAV